MHSAPASAPPRPPCPVPSSAPRPPPPTPRPAAFRADHARPSAQQNDSAPLAAMPIARVPRAVGKAHCDKGESAAGRGLQYKLPYGLCTARVTATRWRAHGKKSAHKEGSNAPSRSIRDAARAVRIRDEAFFVPSRMRQNPWSSSIVSKLKRLGHAPFSMRYTKRAERRVVKYIFSSKKTPV